MVSLHRELIKTGIISTILLLGGLDCIAEVRDVTVGANRALNPDFLGFNFKAVKHFDQDPWNRTELQDFTTRFSPGMVRYPGGTIGNYWDWSMGYDHRNANAHYLPANVKVGSDATGFKPIFVVNCLTRDLQHALDGLAQAQTDGLPIEYVELGNEFYIGYDNYKAAFPTGVEYGQLCQTWIAAIKAQFPGVKCSVAGTMKTNTSRNTLWNSQVFSACTNHDAVTIHYYPFSELQPIKPANGDNVWGTQAEQDAQWTAFNATNGPASMLAQPFEFWNGQTTANNLPAGTDIWVTEYNLNDKTGPTRHTWAHGLYNANQLQNLLVDGRVSRALFHNLMDVNPGTTMTAGFSFGNSFDGLLANHGQGELATTKWNMTASGQVIHLFSDVMADMTSIAPLNISSAPQVSMPGSNPYSAVYGWKTSDGVNAKAILVNTSDTDYDIQTANLAPSASHLRQLSGDPRTYVLNETTVTKRTADALPPILRLPAYSVTTIGGTADPAPAAQATTTHYAIDDHDANEFSPDFKGYGDSDAMLLKNDGVEVKQPHIKFDVQGIAGTVQSATLRVYSIDINRTVAAHSTGNFWDEIILTWNTRPALGAQLDSQSVSSSSWASFDVTAAVNENGLHSFALSSVTINSSADDFATKEAGKAPELIITTSNATPSFSSNLIQKTEANSFSFYQTSLAGDVTDPDGDTLTFKKTSGPAWLTVWSDGTLSGTPDNSDRGANQCVVEVSDGAGLTDQATVQLSVLSEQPNIVLFLVDDLGYGSIGCFGNTDIETPNIDNLAANGMKFTEGYAAAPNCAPSRAAIMTGQYAPQTGVYRVTDPTAAELPDIAVIPPESHHELAHWKITLAEALQAEGYRTGHFGKWHLGTYPAGGALTHGFDTSYENDGKVHFGFTTLPPSTIPTGAYLADYLTDLSEDFIDDAVAATDPFFLYLAHYGIHIPQEAKQVHIDYYTQKFPAGTDTKIIMAAAMIASIDESVGRIVTQLTQLGELDNTLFIFTSDNGGYKVADMRALTSYFNLPWRGMKKDLYEGGLRVPYIFSWPGTIAPGTTSTNQIHGIDLYPTLLDIAGATPDPAHELDGESAVPLLLGNRRPLNPYFWIFPNWVSYDGPTLGWFQGWRNSVLYGDYKLIEHVDAGWVEVYDLASDPAETTDISQTNPTKRDELLNLLDTWKTDRAAPPVIPRLGGNNPPSFTSDPVPEANAPVNQSYSATLGDNANDPDSDTLTFTKVSGPPWLNIASDGTLSGTPAATDAGVNRWTVRIVDSGLGGTAMATLQISVDASPPQTLEFQAIDDSYGKMSKPDTANGDDTYLQLRSTNSSWARIAFIKFTVSGLTGTPSSAVLKVHSISQNGQIDFHRISDTSWTEDALTWNNMPSLGTWIGSAQATPNTWVEIDVSSMVTSNGVYSVAIQTPIDSLGELSSKESGFPPILEIGIITLTPSQLYIDWTEAYPSLSDTNSLSDPDGDLLANLAEYALGGNPTSNDAVSILPFQSLEASNGTNWFNYIYTRRRDAAARRLTYEVQKTTNLVSNIWTNDTEEAGREIIDSDFETVTNRVSAGEKDNQFLRLEIGFGE